MHKTSLITIKSGQKAQVDTGIVRAVNHINSYNGAETTYSCEGDFSESPYDESAPYIQFKANQPTLLNLMRDFQDYDVSVLVVYTDEHGMRFNLRFADKYELQRFESNVNS